jgi:Sulfotransferase family
MGSTVAGLARVQDSLNSCESSYEPWYVLPCRSPYGGESKRASLMAIPVQYLQPAQTVGIVHWGRSGTLLLHSLLDSHPDVLSVTPFFWMYSSQMDQFLASEHGGCPEKLLSFICKTFPYLFEHWPTFFPELFRGKNRDLRFGTDRTKFITHFREYLSYFPVGTPFHSLPAGHTIHSFVLQAIHVAYSMAQGQSLNSKNPTIVWQAHFWQADYFRERFPHIRILSAIRHPYKSYDSWQMNARVPPYWFFHSVRFQQLMEYIKVPPDLSHRCAAIRFEDIHNRTEPAMRALAHWLNIRWDNCLLESTFDGEQYWGVKGGGKQMFALGEIAPVEALVTGTRKFDDSKIDVKHLGLADRLRTMIFCEDAFTNWRYFHSNKAPRGLGFLRQCRSLLLLWPSKLDRATFREEVGFEIQQSQQMAFGPKWVRIAKSVFSFAKKKLRFRKDMLEIQRVQADWCPIPAVFIPDAHILSTSQASSSNTARRAA